jgi:hypothetical protein
MNILLTVFGLTGLAMIIVRGAIFNSIRGWLLAKRPGDIGYLANCPQCMGFWVGLFGGAIYAGLWIAPLYAGAVSLLSAVADRHLFS